MMFVGVDGPAIGRLYPLYQWRPGETVAEKRYSVLPQQSSDGCYRVAVGLFDPITGQRVPVVDGTKQPYSDNAAEFTFNAP